MTHAFGTIEVATTAGTRLAGLVGERLAVSCHHHQSVRTHPGFEPAARAEDGTLEAMEAPGDRFVVGVQWHPETAADVGLLAGLVRAAAAYRAEMDTFVAGVTQGKPLAPTGEDGLKALILADAAEESAKSGKSVRVG